jgi:hypothetical protein
VADESTIRAILVAHAGFTALVPAARVFDQLAPTNMPTPIARPFVVMTTVSDVPFNHVAGAPASAGIRIQFDVYAESKASAKAVLTQIRTALAAAGYGGSEELTQDLPADDPALRRISSDWLFVLSR